MYAIAPFQATRREAAAQRLKLIQIRLISEAIHVVAALGIADLLADGPKSVEQLARAAGASAQSLARTMRALTSLGVFSEEMPDCFTVGPLGEFFQRGAEGSLHAAALFFDGEDAAGVVELFEHCVKTGESATQNYPGRPAVSIGCSRTLGGRKCSTPR
ncbi:methyltransferase dimerization domain-containing protein [Paraburkholderia sp. J63]|uniref:methyltransferase family protein n=1 Tax=Paraburkholderia sp. J63 TaxID=2805434 RepID=UPI002ABE6378|nr:methyltransferase dimerization domain-containing protein [Paraburkholderia sp. J63]